MKFRAASHFTPLYLKITPNCLLGEPTLSIVFFFCFDSSFGLSHNFASLAFRLLLSSPQLLILIASLYTKLLTITIVTLLCSAAHYDCYSPLSVQLRVYDHRCYSPLLSCLLRLLLSSICTTACLWSPLLLSSAQLLIIVIVTLLCSAAYYPDCYSPLLSCLLSWLLFFCVEILMCFWSYGCIVSIMRLMC